MAQISRSTKVGGGTTLQSSTLARAADVETDMLTVFNAHNNHDSGASKWTVVSASGSSSVPLVSDNSSGTQDIADFKDNGTTVVSIVDGGNTAIAPVATSGNALSTTAANGGTGVALVANNGTSTGDIAQFKDNGTTVWNIADGGNLVSNSKKITGLAAGSANGDAIRFEQLKYLQGPVQALQTSDSSTTSSTYQATGLAASITPTSSSNRVMVHVSGVLEAPAVATDEVVVTIKRGSTDIDASGNGFARLRNSSGANILRAPFSVVFVDSPATTSSTTYTLYLKSSDNTNTVKLVGTEATAVITLEEVV